ncbi:MAG: M20/M25/M40 family metallo-hydrolase [Melioribacteraceae bacterium]|nr:M20/M25/M40 family metallo-hydrolase [Melioribacteraceae bacterium]
MKSKLLWFWFLVISFSVIAQEKIDYQMMQRIRQEGLQNSKIPELMSYLCDVYAPRLAGSPQYREAGKWAVEKLKEFGLVNSKMESFNLSARGWEVKKFYAAMTSPQYMPLIAYPKAWTSGLENSISGNAVLMDIKKEEDLNQYKGKLKDAIVLIKGEQEVTLSFEAEATRYTDEDLKKLQLAPDGSGRRNFSPEQIEQMRTQRELQNKILNFIKQEGGKVILEPSRGKHGTIFVQSGGSYRKGSELSLPQIVVSVEQYNRIVRILQKKIPVSLDIDLQANFVDSDSLGYNIIAEIPGTDKKLKDEVVILGGHFDTWHAATGGTDNSAGCAVAMEAVRILKTLGVQPKRTIRIALWDAEEIGLIGSREYVKAHFFDRDKKEKKTEYDKLAAYFNYDNGSGKIRGIYAQGNFEVIPIFEQWLKPFNDLGASTVTLRNTSGTDHLSFDAVGLPGFQFIQDELEYEARTHHSNMDNYDHTVKSDLIQSATIMAAFIYNAAMREEKLPRKYFDPNAIPQRRPMF